RSIFRCIAHPQEMFALQLPVTRLIMAVELRGAIADWLVAATIGPLLLCHIEQCRPLHCKDEPFVLVPKLRLRQQNSGAPGWRLARSQHLEAKGNRIVGTQRMKPLQRIESRRAE